MRCEFSQTRRRVLAKIAEAGENGYRPQRYDWQAIYWMRDQGMIEHRFTRDTVWITGRGRKMSEPVAGAAPPLPEPQRDPKT